MPSKGAGRTAQLRNLPTFQPIPSSVSEKAKARGKKRRKNRDSKESRLPATSEVGVSLREIVRMNRTPRSVFILLLVISFALNPVFSRSLLGHEGTSLKLTGLRTEYKENPLGLD